MMIVIYAAALIVFDRAFPQLVRTFGVGVFPYADAERVGRFYASYGLWAFPRTLFLVAAVGAFAAYQLGWLSQDVGGVIAIACTFGWGLAAFRDVFRARRASD